jgi:hypothetical protein
MTFDRPGVLLLAETDRMLELHRDVGAELARQIGVSLPCALALVPPAHPPSGCEPSPGSLDRALDDLAALGVETALVALACLDLDLAGREQLGERIACARRRHPAIRVRVGAPDPGDPLLVTAFLDRLGEAIADAAVPPDRTGILVVSSGLGDTESRAQAYRLMRHLWERTGAARGEVAFLRHGKRALPEVLEECARSGLWWAICPRYLDHPEHESYVRVIRDDLGRRIPDAGEFRVARTIGDHPAVGEWLRRQLALAWGEDVRGRRVRRPSARRAEPGRTSALCRPGRRHPLAHLDGSIPEALRYGDGVIADLVDPSELPALVGAFGITAGPVFVKVTWHGYAPGTYTEPRALDALLRALPRPVFVVEGHTASRNRGGADWDWETESRDHRAWIAAEDREYLRRTGLEQVLAENGASYLNVTEAWWDGACAPSADVQAELERAGVRLHHPELADHVPAELFAHRGAPFLSFARFKGPTRLCLANGFGLIPVPLRTAWHGPNVTSFARVCCDLARLYGTLFELFGVAESLDVAVRWDREGAYRSRWGNYDLVRRPGVVCMSRGVATADVLASRLQGRPVGRSAFFDVVRAELGFPRAAEEEPIDDELVLRFA